MYNILMRSSKKRSPDFNQIAASLIEKATGANIPRTHDGKNSAAVALGRLGGLKGGKARAEKLSAKERKNIAKKAASVRWGNKIGR